MRNRDAIMIVGCGELGGILLEYLCRVPNIGPIVVADVNENAVRVKVNSALHGASFMGLYPEIIHKPINLLDKAQAAELIARVNPSVIFNGTTLQSWWVVNELPKDVNVKLYRHKAGLGSWVPMHLALTAKLMEAVKASGIDTHVVNSSFPDITNASLSKVGMAPTVGLGNGALLIPYIQKAASEKLSLPRCNIRVEFIAHHYHAYSWARAGIGWEAPHYLKVYDGNRDITQEAVGNIKDFVASLPKVAERPGGRGGQYLVAATALKNVLDIYFDTNQLGMAPGPLGLEGAYPIRLSRKGAELALPAGMTVEKARGLMLEAQEYDGIKSIEDNGDIRLTDEVLAVYKEELHIGWTVVTIKDSLEQATELRKKFLEFLDRNGVPVPK